MTIIWNKSADYDTDINLMHNAMILQSPLAKNTNG